MRFTSLCWGFTANTVYNGGVYFSFHKKPHIDPSCNSCCVVKVYSTMSGKAQICLKHAWLSYIDDSRAIYLVNDIS